MTGRSGQARSQRKAGRSCRGRRLCAAAAGNSLQGGVLSCKHSTTSWPDVSGTLSSLSYGSTARTQLSCAKKIEQTHGSSVPKACLSERIASFPLPAAALSLYRFGCLQSTPPKTMKKSGPFSHGRKVRIVYLGAPDRRIFLQPVLYETRQHVFRPLHLYRPSRQTLPELGEFQKQKRKSTESYDSALFI